MSDINPGEWQVDETGRRFRMIGPIKEWEPTITVGGIEIPQSQIAAHNASMKDQAAARIAKEKATARKAPTHGRCPFSSGMVQSCRDTCALFTPDGCGLVYKGITGQIAGKRCPFSPYPCSAGCELYNDGCTIAAPKGGN